MKKHQIMGVICILTMLVVGYLVFFDAVTIFDARYVMKGFCFGFISGIAWVLLVILDPKSKYYIGRKEEELPVKEELRT